MAETPVFASKKNYSSVKKPLPRQLIGFNWWYSECIIIVN